MNIYGIKVWGPCRKERDVLARRSGPPDNRAVVVASSKDVANQVCYLVATRHAHSQSNYQEVDTFESPIACVLDSAQDPFTFESDIVDDLIADPILPKLIHPDTQFPAGALFFARCIETTGKTRGQFWVYASDATSANRAATEHGDNVGLFDLDSEAIRVELYRLEKTSVFWDAAIIAY